MTPNRIYTTVSSYVAKPGYSFTFQGVAEICRSCSTVKVCLSRFEEGEMYTVVEVGKNRLECKLLEEDAIVVQVKPSLRVLALSSKSAVVGTTLRVQPDSGRSCGDSCLCFPSYVKAGRKYVVRRIVQKTFDCPLGSSRSLVEVEPA